MSTSLITRRAVSAAAAIAMFAVPFAPALAAAAPAPAPCDTVGTPFATITQDISNDTDSGVHGDWATDAFTEVVNVWVGTDNTTYCANAATTNGTFVTTGPLSPEAGVALQSGITGTFTGDENYTFPGTFVLANGYSTSTPSNTTLPPSSSAKFSTWAEDVFPADVSSGSGSNYVNTYSLTYTTASNGTWTNADAVSGGDQGDITGAGSDFYVSTSGNDANDGSQAHPFATIQAAVNAAPVGGTVHVAAGAYSGAITITKNNLSIAAEAGVMVTESASDSFGYGVTVDNASGVSIDGIAFTVPVGAPIGYAFHAYKADGLSLDNLSFTGPGKTSTHIGGVDINTSNNVTVSNVSSTDFYKNGFAVTPQYVSADTAADGISFNNVTASNDGWTGISFYTIGNDKTDNNPPAGFGGSASMHGVTFSGSNTISNDGIGIFVEGDTDANHIANSSTTAPINTVTSDGSTLALGSIAFNGNTSDFRNFQTAAVDATNATFGGQTGLQMDATSTAAEDAKIFDQKDNAVLGLVTYVGTVIETGHGGGHTSASSNSSSSSSDTGSTGDVGGDTGDNGQVLGASTFNFTASADATVGSTGEAVSALQQVLIDLGFLKIGAPTGFFGPLTQAALAGFQSAHGISPAAGYFGPLTRAFMDSMPSMTQMTPDQIQSKIDDLTKQLKALQEKLADNTDS